MYNANEESYIQYKVTKIVTFKIFTRFKIKLGYHIDKVDKEREREREREKQRREREREKQRRKRERERREREREMMTLTFLFNTKSQLFRVPFLRERERERGERQTCLYKFSLKIFKF